MDLFNTYAVCTAQNKPDIINSNSTSNASSDAINDITIPTLGYQCKIHKYIINEPKNTSPEAFVIPVYGPKFSYKLQIIQHIEKYRSRYSGCCDYTTDKFNKE